MDIEPSINFDIQLPTTRNINRIQVQEYMSHYAGIVKSNQGLMRASELLNELDLHSEMDLVFDFHHFESNIVLQVAKLLIKDAINKKENKGVFYNKDLVG